MIVALVCLWMPCCYFVLNFAVFWIFKNHIVPTPKKKETRMLELSNSRRAKIVRTSPRFKDFLQKNSPLKSRNSIGSFKKSDFKQRKERLEWHDI